MGEILTWVALVACITQSATLSGLNLAVFSVSRLRLEAAADAGDTDAARVLLLRRDAHFTLTTVLLANVSVNVLLTLLADSILPAVGAFLVSTLAITLFGEILPQAYFTRHALRVIAVLFPLLRAYQILLWPVAKPIGMLLDRVVGPEGIPWFREAELRDVLRHHAVHGKSEVGRLEAIGAMNFLALDDLPVGDLGTPQEPDRTLALPHADGLPVLPAFERSASDPFLRRLAASRETMMTITDEAGEPRFVLDVDAFLRDALLSSEPLDPGAHCRRPLVIRDDRRPLGEVISRFASRADAGSVTRDPILVWNESNRRIITGRDILDRLLQGTSGAMLAPPAAHPAIDD